MTDVPAHLAARMTPEALRELERRRQRLAGVATQRRLLATIHPPLTVNAFIHILNAFTDHYPDAVIETEDGEYRIYIAEPKGTTHGEEHTEAET